MALVAWYPLNGDTLDYSGNKNHLNYIYNSGLIVSNASGKIGACYERTALNTAADALRAANMINLPYSFTMACWAYVSECHSGTANGLVTNHSHSTNTGAGITVREMSSTDFRISCNTGNGTSRTYISYYGTTNIKDKWSHLLIRYDKKTNLLSLWVNGSKEYEISYSMATKNDYLDVFNWSTSYISSASYRPKCKLNDVRIYDHALSEKEIKEIAKAKILHYSFDDFQEPTENLYNVSKTSRVLAIVDANSTLSYGTSVEINGEYAERIIKTATTPSSHASYRKCITSTAGGIYTVSWWVRLISGDISTIGKHFRGGTSSLNFSKQIGNDYYFEYTGTIEGTTLCVGVGFIGESAIDCYIYKPQLEQKDHATPFTPSSRPGTVKDISGYNNDATLALSTTPTWIEDSKIGNGAYKFDGVNEINTDKLFNFNRDEEFTISIWVNPLDHSDKAGAAAGIIGKGHWYNNTWDVWICNTNAIYFECSGNPTREGRITLTSGVLPLQEWSYIVITYKTGLVKLYLNGVLKSQATYSGLGNFNNTYNMFVGMRPGDISRRFKGSIDDVRIYATALSNEDVKELYMTRASLDNKGNLSVRDIDEPYNFLNPDLFYKYANNPETQTPQIEVVDGRDTWSVYPHYFHPNRVLNNLFKENTQYKIHFVFKHYTIDQDIYRPGGLIIYYTDGTTSYLICTGNTGWNTIDLVTPKDKTIKEVGVYYYTSYRVYIDSSSYFREYRTNFINNKGVLRSEQVSEVGPTDGLVVWYPLSGHANDVCGGNHGTINGAVPVAGIDGAAMSFDGVDDYIDCGNGQDLVLSNGGSISAWIKLSSFNSTSWSTTIVGKGGSSWPNHHYILFKESGTNHLLFSVSNGTNYLATNGPKTTDLSLTTWYHVVATWDNQLKCIYLNGQLCDSVTSSIMPISSADSVSIGRTGTNGYYLDGIIQDVRIYNRALSPEEIKMLYDLKTTNNIMKMKDNCIYVKGQVLEVD